MAKKSQISFLNRLAGHYAKVGAEAGTGLREFKIPSADLANFTTESKITVEIFQEGQKVDVTGTTIGKGFQGAIKRHHFAAQQLLMVYHFTQSS